MNLESLAKLLAVATIHWIRLTSWPVVFALAVCETAMGRVKRKC